MSDPDAVVEVFGCDYRLGNAVKALLEAASLERQSTKRRELLATALHHVLLEIQHVDGSTPDSLAFGYAETLMLRSFVAELGQLPPGEQVLSIKGLVVSAVRNTLEDLIGQG